MLSERICTRCKCNICVEGRYWSAGYCSHCGGKLSGVIASVGRFVNGVEMRFWWRAVVADDVEMFVRVCGVFSDRLLCVGSAARESVESEESWNGII